MCTFPKVLDQIIQCVNETIPPPHTLTPPGLAAASGRPGRAAVCEICMFAQPPRARSNAQRCKAPRSCRRAKSGAAARGGLPIRPRDVASLDCCVRREFFHPEWVNKRSNHSSALCRNSRMNNAHTCCVISLQFAADLRVKALHFASRNNLPWRSKPRPKTRISISPSLS